MATVSTLWTRVLTSSNFAPDLFEEDAEFFHEYYKAVCDRYDPTLYQQSKAACDAYFYIPARKEHRGIGGIFFDDLENFQQYEDSGLLASRSAVFSFVKDVAEGFMPSYLPIAQKRRHLSYGEEQRQWQLLRRGRYLEFNLLYDRGVKFGLDGGRFESIMVSGNDIHMFVPSCTCFHFHGHSHYFSRWGICLMQHLHLSRGSMMPAWTQIQLSLNCWVY